ncbi:uncharacterized protein [Palaemon carinicauda]|uniref:uncharacterized protein n=1 Tax=Palaemon carinicauda TaxID=392227 RepID=UPI0035B5850E
MCAYFYDSLVSGLNFYAHEEHISEVLRHFKEVELKLPPNKCSIGVDRVQYLGYTIASTGLRSTKKFNTIINSPEPKNIMQLTSYLEIFNFYRKFLISAAVILEPLNDLLRKTFTLGGNLSIVEISKILSQC